MAYGEDITIRLDMLLGTDEISPGLQEALVNLSQLKDMQTEFTRSGEMMTLTLSRGNKAVEEAATRVSSYMISTRVLSRDLMTVGYSFNYLNRELLGHNQILQDVVTTLILFGAALRIVAVIQNFSAWFSASSAAASAFSWVLKMVNLDLAQMAFWTAVITGGALLLIGLGAWAALQAAQPKSMQFGGVVPETGPYILHRGETVVPAGGPKYSWVNINMYTGPISSSMDLDRIADELATRVTVEQRRRGIF